jgi:cytochrome c553
LSAGLLSIAFCVEAGTAAGENDDVLTACGGCHQGPLALDRFGADDLLSRLKRVRDGDTPHPPLNLDEDDDHALEDLAGRISAAGSDG